MSLFDIYFFPTVLEIQTFTVRNLGNFEIAPPLNLNLDSERIFKIFDNLIIFILVKKHFCFLQLTWEI